MGICESQSNRNINADSLNNPDYRSEKAKKEVIINHGFFDNVGAIPMGKIEDNMIKQKDYNVFQVINNDEEKLVYGTGFLCLIPFPDILNRKPYFITCYHVLKGNEKKVKLKINETIKTLKLDSRKMYCDKEQDITMIEIKKEDNFNNDRMLEIDCDIFEEKDLNKKFKKVYIIHFPGELEANISFGICKITEDKTILHNCPTKEGSSGAPIFNYNTFKVIGIHKGENKELKCNIGLSLKESIDNFINMTRENKMEILDNNGKYVGDVINGIKEGYGVFKFKNGDIYEGYYKNNEKDGKGILKYHDGDIYDGYFKNGKREGKGIYTFNNGDKYEGKYKNDNREEEGTYHFKSGKKVNCTYLNGKGIK